MNVLYVVGKGSPWDHNEFRYSLRSVARNFPHDKVIVSGHCPSWVKDVTVIPGTDKPNDRVKNVQRKLLKALESGEVGERFALFNDDFYILQPWTSNAIRYVGQLLNRVHRARNTRPPNESWRRALEATFKLCQDFGLEDPLDFGAHHPCCMERDKAIEVVRYSLSLPVAVDVNTLYCLFHGAEVERTINAKSYKWKGPPTGPVFSTCPDVERLPVFRKWIDGVFPDPCRYER